MKLKIKENSEGKLDVALGISTERGNEICQKLTIIMREYVRRSVVYQNIKLANMYWDIAEVCNTPEELIFAVEVNCRWMIKTKMIEV